jgi:hypothetical protein
VKLTFPRGAAIEVLTELGTVKEVARSSPHVVRVFEARVCCFPTPDQWVMPC